jgi:hypothetical protein
MAEVIPFLTKRNVGQQDLLDNEQALAADAALGDVARVLRAMLAHEADQRALPQLSASLLALLPLMQHEQSGTRALDELYEVARRLVHDRQTSPQLVSEKKRGLYAAYGAFRTQVAAALARTSPAIAIF